MSVAEKLASYDIQEPSIAQAFFAKHQGFLRLPGGVLALRDLILDLAVRGKLSQRSEQDNDAELLLNEVVKQRDELGQSGVIRGARPFSPIDAKSFPFKLPDGWTWVFLEFLTQKMGAGSTPLGGKKAYVDDGVAFLRSQNVWNEGLRLHDVARIPEATHERMSGTHVMQGDVLLNITGASIGRCALVPDDLGEANVSQHVAIIRLVDRRLRYFLHLCMISPFFQRTIMDVQVGVSREGLSMNKLKRFPFPLPPLAEQRRIVSKVDRLMGLCDRLESERAEVLSLTDRSRRSVLSSLTSSRDASELSSGWRRLSDHFEILHDRPETLADLRQTILALAVQGKLTARLTDCEDASSILQATRELRSELLNAKSVRKVKKPIAIEHAELTELPDRWCWSRLGAILLDLRYGTSRKCETLANGVPVLRIPNVVGGNVDITHLKYTEMPEDEASELAVRPGDLLVIRSNGSQSIVGSATVVTDEINGFAFAGYLVRLRIPINLISAKYLQLALSSSDVRSQIEGSLRTTSGVKNVNSSEIGNLLVPLPPLPEQELVVAKVDRLVAKCDRVAEKLRNRQATTEQLLTATIHRILEASV